MEKKFGNEKTSYNYEQKAETFHILLRVHAIGTTDTDFNLFLQIELCGNGMKMFVKGVVSV
jgi:hypothetical protein